MALVRRCAAPPAVLLPLLCTALFTIQLGLSLSDVPSARLLQDVVCRQLRGDAGDALCRDAAVLREVNAISVGVLVSMTVASALVAFPLGVLSDRIGRLPVVGLGVASMVLSQAYAMFVCWQWRRVPVRAIWAMGVPLLLGGGRSVTEAAVLAMAADVAPEKRRASWFQCLAAAVLAAQLCGPALAGPAMQPSVWLPLWLSIGLVLTGGALVVGLAPETRPRGRPVCAVLSPRAVLRSLGVRPGALLVPGAVLAGPVAAAQSDVVVRLMPVRFAWPLDRAAVLASIRSIAAIVVLVGVLPAAAHLSSWSPLRRDVVLARASALLFLAGSVGLAMVSRDSLVVVGFIISAFGPAIPTLCRSMFISVAGNRSSGSLLGALAVGEVLGSLACLIGIGWLFDFGLTTWIGLPFCLASLLAMAVFAAMCMFPASGVDMATEGNAEAHGIGSC